ncbi:MAG: tRNA dihydrouridine synthase DusB [Betaproteobacteria bacterium]|jgi:tRNA-dihydrouridine synthase B|nr:MAG: tRNA dihydrouridine synthase DusB [Betaproteobacteria bacterium]
MQIGQFNIPNRVVAAPMAGVTDRPFRQLCKRLGADMAVSEMVAANSALWNTRKSRLRRDHTGEAQPIVVQIAGGEPKMMAESAKHNVQLGAQIIDINMGCPAKKVCNVAAGSALLKDEPLVGRILSAVVNAVEVPVTLKIRTGWSQQQRNAIQVARMAEAAGIRALAVHGRTRADLYGGEAEYDTIAEVKTRVNIPVIANGDIDTPHKARQVLDYTGADAVMVGRAAQGRPWLFREISYFLAHGRRLSTPSFKEIRDLLTGHLTELYSFYGDYSGVRVARKHIGWYLSTLGGGDGFRRRINGLESAQEQLSAVRSFFDSLASHRNDVTKTFGQAA